LATALFAIPAGLHSQETASDTDASVEVVPLAPASTQQVVSVFHSGWGKLREDGSLHGRALALGPGGAQLPQQGAAITIERNGVVVATASTDGDGRFVVEGLQPGVHQLRADAASATAIHSFQLVSVPEAGESVMNIYCASMPLSEVDRIVAQMWAPGNWFEAPRSSFARLLEPEVPNEQNPRVSMVNGVVSGQLAFPHPNHIPEGHIVKVFRAGQQIAESRVDEMGRFTFEPGSAGPADIVVGGGGYGSIGVEIVDASPEPQLSQNAAGDVHYVAARALLQASDSLLVPVAGGGEGGAPGQAPPGEPAPYGPGYMGGGGGYGGGGGGGYGGFGGLGGAAALALAAVALAVDDDDGFNGNPVTPVAP
jgi:hypothetical protein